MKNGGCSRYWRGSRSRGRGSGIPARGFFCRLASASIRVVAAARVDREEVSCGDLMGLTAARKAGGCMQIGLEVSVGGKEVGCGRGGLGGAGGWRRRGCNVVGGVLGVGMGGHSGEGGGYRGCFVAAGWIVAAGGMAEGGVAGGYVFSPAF